MGIERRKEMGCKSRNEEGRVDGWMDEKKRDKLRRCVEMRGELGFSRSGPK